MLIYCGELYYVKCSILQDNNRKGRVEGTGKRGGNVFFFNAEVVSYQKRRNQNFSVELYCTVRSRADAKPSSGHSAAGAPQGAIPVCLTTAGHIYHSAGLCNHRNIIQCNYHISLKIHILKV